MIEDWVLERRYRAVPESRTIPAWAAPPCSIRYCWIRTGCSPMGITVPQVVQQLSTNNSNAGGGFYSQGGQFYYVRGLGLVKTTEDIGNIVLATNNGIPTYVKDVAKVEIGSAVRLGQFGYMKQDDAVEGVILMRVGEQAQVVLKRVQDLTKELNQHVLPPDVKIVPYYDRSALVEETTQTVERQPAARHAAGADHPGAVSVQRAHRPHCGAYHSVRPDVCVHLPGLAAHPRQPAFHRRDRLRHPGGRRRGHGGERVSRAGAAPRSTSTT